jgi:hypothetical protein
MVKFPKKNKWDKPFSERIANRVRRIPTNDLTTWADQTIFELGRILTIYERNRTPEASKELADAAEALHAVAHEINKRTNNTIK